MILFKNEPGTQVKSYIWDIVEIAVNFMSFLNKAIDSSRDIGGSVSEQQTIGYEKSTYNYNTRSLTCNNAVDVEKPLHDAISVRLTEVIQASDSRAKDPRMKEVIAEEIEDFGPSRYIQGSAACRNTAVRDRAYRTICSRN